MYVDYKKRAKFVVRPNYELKIDIGKRKKSDDGCEPFLRSLDRPLHIVVVIFLLNPDGT